MFITLLLTFLSTLKGISVEPWGEVSRERSDEIPAKNIRLDILVSCAVT